MAKEKDTIRVIEGEEPVETKAFDYSKYFVDTDRVARDTDDEERDFLDPKEEKRRRRAEQLEDKAHQAELQAQAVEFAPIIMALGGQMTDRFTPDMPYKYDEALALSKAVVNFGDKHSDGFLGEYKEEFALVVVSLSQIVPRYLMWKAKQPVDLSNLPNRSVPQA